MKQRFLIYSPWDLMGISVLFFDTDPAVWDSPQFHYCYSHTQGKSVPLYHHFYQKAGRQLSWGSFIKSTVAIWQQRSSVPHWLQARIPLSLCWIWVHFSTFPLPLPYCIVKGAEGKVQNTHQQFWLSNIQNNQNLSVLMAPRRSSDRNTLAFLDLWKDWCAPASPLWEGLGCSAQKMTGYYVIELEWNSTRSLLPNHAVYT